MRIAKVRRELGHAIFLAMDEEGAVRTGLSLPSQQISLVGMSRKAVDGVNARFDRDLFAKNSHLLGTINNATRESPAGCVANKHDGRLFPAQIVLQVMANTSAGAHA